MKNSIKGFYESLADGQPIPVSGEDGEKIVRFCERWIDCANPTPNKVLEITPNTEKPKDPKVLITGATGFLGKNLLKHLVDKGVAVRALVRSEKGLSKLFYHPLVEVYKGNLLDEKSLDGATKGVEYIYHLAHALGNTWDEFKEINIKSTRCLAEAGLKQGIKNFIFTSTIATYYTGDLESPHVDETMAIDPESEKRNFYARSKMILEEMLLAMHKKDKLPLVLFRPAVVLGEGGTPYHPGIGQWSRDNVCAYWGWGKNDLPFVLVDDISSALIKVMETEGLDGEIFNLAGDVRFSAREYIDYIRKSSGRNIMSFPYPMRLCFISESLKYFVKFIGRSHQGTLLSYRDLKNRSILADFDNTKAKQLLSWQPCTDKRHFIQVTIENLF